MGPVFRQRRNKVNALMTIAQHVVSGLALLVAVWVSAGNWYCVILYVVKRRHSSWIPFIGGVVGCFGFFVSPYSMLRTHWWLPLFLDWGTVPGHAFALVYFTIALIRRATGKGGGDGDSSPT
jgi:hypothetical protein